MTVIPVAKARQLVDTAKDALAELVVTILTEVFETEFTIAEVTKEFSTPKPEFGDITIACFSFLRKLKPKNDAIKAKLGADVNPNMIANTIAKEIMSRSESGSIEALAVNGKSAVKNVGVAGAYVNVMLSLEFHGQVVYSVLAGQFQARPTDAHKDKVMIEYSQPNTHKAFHVGHMRNAALGDSLVRLYEQAGHEVVAVNYFGDEGAHVAKCLWYLQKVYLPKAKEAFEKGLKYDAADPNSVYPMASIDDIDVIPVEARAEWLGDLYTKAVDLLDLSLHTDLPFPMVIAAKVLTKASHPDPEAPANWHVCTLDIGSGKEATVVCGGVGYEVGDLVAYLPVGAKLTKKMGVIEPKDMRGVASCGVMLAERELGMGEEEEAAAKKGKKGASANAAATASNKIFKLPATATAGENLAEIGRKPEFVGASVMAEYNKLKKEAADVLLALEHGDAEQVALWRKTGQWSLDEFHAIYKWLDCRFDHDFTESEVSEPSRELVHKWLENGFLQYSNGAVVADLTEHNLGKCTLLKSDGAGLYATKDLALATRKFDQFKIDKSIYVVDAAQTYHFQQVFKTLELAGYEQAKKCVHLPYGLVVLPSGRMSSRKGNVMLFSQLRSTITRVLKEKYSRETEISDETCRRIAVAAIKYGMLNHDTSKDIVFELEKWTQNTGNTGPYILYAFSRIMSIFTVRENYDGPKFDLVKVLKSMNIDYTPFVADERFNLGKFFTSDASKPFFDAVDFDKYLDNGFERALILHMHKFWPTIIAATEANNPSPVCDYVFTLAQFFSNWYEQVRLTAVAPEAVPSKLALIYSVSEIISTTMKVLGITVINKM